MVMIAWQFFLLLVLVLLPQAVAPLVRSKLNWGLLKSCAASGVVFGCGWLMGLACLVVSDMLNPPEHPYESEGLGMTIAATPVFLLVGGLLHAGAAGAFHGCVCMVRRLMKRDVLDSSDASSSKGPSQLPSE